MGMAAWILYNARLENNLTVTSNAGKDILSCNRDPAIGSNIETGLYLIAGALI
jgi:hypothetical protein